MGKGEDNRGRNTKEGFLWKNLVLERDCYKCQHCGTDKRLCAHHIIEWFDDESLRYVVSNGLTLCVSCHRAHHNKIMTPPNKGKKFSDERRAQMSALMKGKTSPNKGKKTGKPAWNTGKTYKRKGVSPLKGRKLSKEHADKLGAALREISRRPEIRQAHSKRTKGKKWIIDPITNKRKWILD